jgi:hypothetical protein
MTPLKGQLTSVQTTVQPVAQQTPQKQKRPLTTLEGIVVGTVAGVMEVSIDQPLVTLKNQMQRKDKGAVSAVQILKNLSSTKAVQALWSGWSSNAAGLAVVTAMQVVGTERFKGFLSQDGAKTLSEKEKLASTVAAGVVSATVAGPSEMVTMRHEARTKAFLDRTKDKPTAERPPNYTSTVKDVYAKYGFAGFTRGLAGTAVRDAGFTVAYSYGGTFFKEKYMNYFSDPMSCTIAGGVTSGVIGAVVTHPFDTWKTQKQSGQVTEFWPKGFQDTLKKVFTTTYEKEGSYKAFKATVEEALKEPYRGFGPRATRVVMAVTVMNLVTEKLGDTLRKNDK